MGSNLVRHQPGSQLLELIFHKFIFHQKTPRFLQIYDGELTAITANLWDLSRFKLYKNVSAGIEDIRVSQHLSGANFPSCFPSVGTCQWCMAKHPIHSRGTNNCQGEPVCRHLMFD